MFVADSPQGEDLKTKYALSGYKESLLKDFAKNANLQFNEFYLTCLAKDELPPFEREGKKKPTEAEVAKWYLDKLDPRYATILKDEINTLRPNLVIPLGEMGFQFLSGMGGIRKFRGSILKLNPSLGIEKYTKILPILGPYPYLNTEYKLKFITQIDFNKISKWQSDQPVPDDTYRIWVARSSAELRNFIDRAYPICAAKSVEEGGFLVFDIESYMNVPTCISFCFDGFESCCIPFLDLSIDRDNRVLMFDLVCRVLGSPLPKVNQNIKYDWKTLERWSFLVANVIGDTMLAASTLYCEFPKNLGFLTSIYTDIPYFKDEGRQFDPSKHKKDQFYLYNAKDSLATHQIYSQQIVETKELGVGFVYDRLIQLMPIYRKMEDTGIRIDEEAKNRLLAKYESLYRIHKLTLENLTNYQGINPLSAPGMIHLVFEELGYKRIRGVKNADEDSLNMLMAFGNPSKASKGVGKAILQEIIWCRKFHKVIEILGLEIYPDKRFRCEFNLAGTETGRTSAGKTTDYFIYPVSTKKGQKVKTTNLGHSLQTIGKHGFFIGDTLYGTDIRNCFVPSVGYRFVEIDLSGAEARVDRVLSGNFDMGPFSNPGIHKLTGSWIFNCLPSEIEKGTLRYHAAKTARHAAERNVKSDRFFIMLQDQGAGTTLEEADRMLKKLHETEPAIQRIFHRDIEAAIRSPDHSLVCPNGRRRDFFDRINHHTINEGISFLPQAIVSDQNKFSFIPTFNSLPWARLLVEAHDGSLSEVPIGREQEFYNVYRGNIETPINFRRGTLKRDYELTIPCEVEVGDNWGEMGKLQ